MPKIRSANSSLIGRALHWASWVYRPLFIIQNTRNVADSSIIPANWPGGSQYGLAKGLRLSINLFPDSPASDMS